MRTALTELPPGTCKGGFQNRRDCAIISVSKDTGARLSKLAELRTGDVLPRASTVVMGKGDKLSTAIGKSGWVALFPPGWRPPEFFMAASNKQ